jgi:hypothetical protein
MDKMYKKLLCLGLVVAIAAVFPAILSGCDKKETSVTTPISSVSATLSDTVGVTTPVFVTEPKTLEEMYDPKLVALLNRTFSIGDQIVSAGEYNYTCVSAFQELSTYAQYGYYPADESGMLDLSATCDLTENGSGTWGDYLVRYVEEDLQSNYILSALAEENSMKLSDEMQAQIDENMKSIDETAATIGLTGDGYLEQYCGDDMTLARFKAIVERLYLADIYASDYLANYSFTEEELALPIVRHILYAAPRNGLREQDASEEEIAKALEDAENTLLQVKGYDDMVLIGDKHTRDGTALESAEYTVSKGEMVKEFEAWCFDATRKVGDKEIVRTDFGFHVIFFVGSAEADEEQKKMIAQTALLDMLEERAMDARFALKEE